MAREDNVAPSRPCDQGTGRLERTDTRWSWSPTTTSGPSFWWRPHASSRIFSQETESGNRRGQQGAWVVRAIPRRQLRPSTSGPTVLMLGESLVEENPGGLNRYFEELASALREIGTPLRTVRLGSRHPDSEGHLSAGSRSRQLPWRVVSFWRAAAALAPEADVVDAHFAVYALLPIVATRLRSKPLIVHFQGPWAEESLVAGERSRVVLWAKHRVEAALYRRADRLVTLSEAFKTVLVRGYGVDPSRVEVIPPGVDLNHFSVGDRADSRRLLGLSDGQFVAVVARRLTRRMGLDVLLSAWPEVANRVKGATLLVVGDGPERDRLEQLAAAVEPKGSIQFLGKVDDRRLVIAYQAANISVVPSVALEGFGLVALEALACGTPVVVTDCGGLPEAVAGLDPSLIVPAADQAALASRLIGAATGELPDPAACRSYAEQFSWRKAAEANRGLYLRARRLRVVFLDHVARLSGGELALARLVPELDVEAHVILGEDGPLACRLRHSGVRVEILPLGTAARDLRRNEVKPLPGAAPALATARYIATLTRRLRQVRPDLVHTNSLKSALYGGLAARAAGVPVVVHLRDRLAPDYLAEGSLRVAQATIHYLASGLVANSASTLETVRWPPWHTAIVPSGVPQAWCERPIRNREAGKGPLRVGMVGRIAHWKGQQLFLEAFADAFPDNAAEAVIAGSALFGEEAYEDALRGLVRDLGLQERVRFTGFAEDIWGELEKLDVLVHASLVPEPFGQVVLEGMAAGLPVIATRAGGPAEVITDGVDGLLVAPGSKSDLTSALRYLARDPIRRQQLGQAARLRASTMTVEAATPAVLDLYRRVLELVST